VALGKFLQTTGTPRAGQLRLAADSVPRPGAAPVFIPDARCYLVNLRPGEGGFRSAAGNRYGGLVALYQTCTHLGQCTLPWRPDFAFEGIQGWFRCPCHGSTYTKGGVCVFGPAMRNMDTLSLTTAPDGSLTLRTAPIHPGEPRPPAP
jgi:cytochrome b6-f complex iron-sulfur subunit